MTHRPTSTTVVSVLLLIVLATAGCGTRVERSATPAPAGTALGGFPVASSQSTPAEATRGSGSSAEAAPTGATTSQSVPVAAASGGKQPSGAGRVTSAPTAPTRSEGTGPTQGQAVPSPGSASGGTPGAGPGVSNPGGEAVPAGSRSPIVVASVGSYSGPIGSVIEPTMKGAQLWVRAMNDRGGVNGHLIKQLVYDDGGDPARHRAQVQEAVERQGVLALFADGGTIAGQGSVDYINSHRVPVVGIDGGQNWSYTTPWWFPQTSNGTALLRTFAPSTAGQLLPKGKKKFGSLICVEGAICDEAAAAVQDTAEPSGLQYVYKGRASIAQPDFTAECLSARNQGAEILLVIMDQNSANRVAASCARQSYRPTFALIGQGVADRLKEDPNLEGTVASSTVFPYFLTGTPASDEFQAAYTRYGKGLLRGVGIALGWTSGKLMERAAANLPEPPTREALLAGLWSIKNDTLGGITRPLTFVPDEPAKPLSCWFDLTISKGEWLSPDGGKVHCLP